MKLSEIFSNMGLAGWSVVGCLLLLSMYALAVSIEKWRAFRSARHQSQTFLSTYSQCLRKGNLRDAMAASKACRESHLARVVSAGVAEMVDDGPVALDARGKVEAVSRALARESALTAADMKKGLGGLATIGSTAPFIGLAGTVMGIINAFQGIAATGSGGLAGVSAGISEALVTTVFGLLVAIPSVMAFNYFTAALERFNVEMSHSSAELMDFLLKRTSVPQGGR